MGSLLGSFSPDPPSSPLLQEAFFLVAENKVTLLKGFPAVSVGRIACNAGIAGSPGWEDPLEEDPATHFSILFRKIPTSGLSGY